MFLSFFTTRYILEALGEVNFGLYNIIAGIVFLFSFIATTMATTSQRFISYSMGASKDIADVKKVIGASISLHMVIAVVAATFVVIGGLIFIYNILNIPSGSYGDATFILYTVSVGLIGTILSVPFEAILMAHENIIFVTLCQICSSLSRLVTAIVLLSFSTDRLRIYAVIMSVIPFILLFVQALYCLHKYSETRFSISDLKHWDLFREMGQFAGWVMVGTTCTTIRNQGVSILLNMFWGVIVNAANGIAGQVSCTLAYFSTSLTTSLRPQLVKSAGNKDIQRMNTLIIAACKYPLLLISLFGIPLIIAMPYILSLWLKTVPDYTSTFCRLLIISTLFNQSTIGLTIGMEACGKIKYVHTCVGITFLLMLPIGYLLAAKGFSPQSIMWCVVVSEIAASIIRIIIAAKTISLNVTMFVKDIIIRSALIIAIVTGISYFVWTHLVPNIFSFLIFGIVYFVEFLFMLYFIGLNRSEQIYLCNHIRKIYSK